MSRLLGKEIELRVASEADIEAALNWACMGGGAEALDDGIFKDAGSRSRPAAYCRSAGWAMMTAGRKRPMRCLSGWRNQIIVDAFKLRVAIGYSFGTAGVILPCVTGD